MQQRIKSIQSFKWMLPVLTVTMLFCACGSAETKTDGTNADSMSVKQAPADSATATPMTDSMGASTHSMGIDTIKIDSSANGRPDGGQTGPPSQN